MIWGAFKVSAMRQLYPIALTLLVLISLPLSACIDTATGTPNPAPVEETPDEFTDSPSEETPPIEDPADEPPGEEPPAEDTLGEDAERADLRLETAARGFSLPIYVTNAGDGSERLFVVEKIGRIKVVKDGEVLPTPFLDISGLITEGSERGEVGLLGLAFHPDYAENGFFFVNYTDSAGDTRVVRYTVSSSPDVADAGSAQLVLTFGQPASNHNGGHLAFGPDGMLYIATGDGGSTPQAAQQLDTLLGKILRLDVDGGIPYVVPSDNPFIFIDDTDARPEIWALGLRNPWRFSFDAETGDMFIGDVGQNRREEISFQSANSEGGENYGWDITEGGLCYPSGDVAIPENCDVDGLTLPIISYDREAGVSVTGGYVYRGEAIPSLRGDYLYGDFGSGRVWAAQPGESGWTSEEVLQEGQSLASFGEDEQGELYVVNLGAGSILKVVAD